MIVFNPNGFSILLALPCLDYINYKSNLIFWAEIYKTLIFHFSKSFLNEKGLIIKLGGSHEAQAFSKLIYIKQD